LIGRSNVGKSTLINALTGTSIAKTSKTPGRTQLVNFFDLGGYRLVDLPGYGYAKVGMQKHSELAGIIDEYLAHRVNLFAVLQICDANVITKDDVQMSIYCNEKFKHHYVLLNKIDKQNISRYQNNMGKTCQFLHVKPEQIILISAKNKVNLSRVFTLITNLTEK
jgi:GTP-binding protein